MRCIFLRNLLSYCRDAVRHPPSSVSHSETVYSLPQRCTRKDLFLQTSIILQLIFLLILLYLSGFFSSAETAMTTVNRLRIRSLAEDGDARAAVMMKVLDQSDKMLSVILIGNNIVNISASSIATTLTMQLFGSAAVSLSTGLLTLLVLIFGEITPKTTAAADPERLCLRYAGIIWRLMYVLTPVVWLVNRLAGFAIRMHQAGRKSEESVTEDDIRTLVDAGREEGVLEEQEHAMLSNVFDFTDAQVREVMVPRADMVTVGLQDTYEAVREVFYREKFSRLPVCRDGKDDIVGVINIKDFMFFEHPEAFRVQDIMYEPYYTYENKKTAELLREMRSHSIGLTIVLDEYAAVTGMVTLEDLLEELVGEIRDEYDVDEEDLIRRLDSHTYLIEGSVKLDDVNDALGLHLHSDNYDSIGGYVIDLTGQLPGTGQSVRTPEGLSLTVTSMHRRRIDRIRLVMPDRSDPSADHRPDSGSN